MPQSHGLLAAAVVVLSLVSLATPVATAPFFQAAQQHAAARPELQFQLPLMEGADPFVTRVGEDYLVLVTRFVDIAILRVRDLNDLDRAEPHVVFCADSGLVKKEIWAPELLRVNGRWYIYATALRDPAKGLGPGSDQFVLESVNASDPMGPYRWRGWLDTTSGIDGTVLPWRGAHYYVWSQFSWDVPQPSPPQQVLMIAPMRNPWTLELDKAARLSQPWHDWEKVGNRVNEGPAVIQRNGRLFILYSASLCWTPDYKLGILEFKGSTHSDILRWDKWEKGGAPVLQKSEYNGVWGPGHCSVTTTPDGRWLVMYHSKVQKDPGEGRVVNVMEFSWGRDGRPLFGKPAGVPARHTYAGQRRQHPTLNYKEQPVACNVQLAPAASPEEDAARADELVLRPPQTDRLTLAAFVLLVGAAAMVRWRSKANTSAGWGLFRCLHRNSRDPRRYSMP